MDTFKAGTWNAGTTPDEVGSVVRDSRNRGTSLWLFQELSLPSERAILHDMGLRLIYAPRQSVIAWDPSAWVKVDSRTVKLSHTLYWHSVGSDAQLGQAALGILSDMKGRTLTALSYHPPAHVQRRDPAPGRWAALRETARSWRNLANAAETRACLFGGDDNVDERLGNGPWGFMLRRATGLRQITAPAGTHGRRRIDDFRVRGLEAVGPGAVFDTPSDHRLYEQRFAWTAL